MFLDSKKDVSHAIKYYRVFFRQHTNDYPLEAKQVLEMSMPEESYKGVPAKAFAQYNAQHPQWQLNDVRFRFYPFLALKYKD